MPETTAWERKNRRRDVVRLKAQGYTAKEISDELGWATSTIRNDLQRIGDELSKWDDKEVLGKDLRQALRHVLEHEYEDLRRAERESDEQAKHRAKSSMRSTVETIKKIEDDLLDGSDDSSEPWFEQLDDDTRESIADAAEDDVRQIIGGSEEG